MNQQKNPVHFSKQLGDAIELVAIDPCANYSFFKLEEIVHNNLGGKGPETGEEGLVFKAVDAGKDGTGKEVLLKVNVNSGEYTAPKPPYINGLSGQYGQVDIAPGSTVHLRFRVYDPESQQPIRLPKVDFTFFDLDQGPNKTMVESITISNFTNFITMQSTEVVITRNFDGSATFTGSTYGTGLDNPYDPLLLTLQQKNRAVTFEFEEFTEMHVTLSSTPGQHLRRFNFVGRPAVLCAMTTYWGDLGSHDSDNSTVVVSPSITTGTTTSSPEERTMCCLHVIQWDLFCRDSKEWWTFWC